MANADQSGFVKEMISGRSLAPTGVKDVERVVQIVASTTHSYTVMPTIYANGTLGKKLFVVLQEPSGSFPQRFNYAASNLSIHCHSSHIMTKDLMKTWLRECVFTNEMPDQLLLIVDSWTSFRDHQTIQSLVPEVLTISHLHPDVEMKVCDQLNSTMILFLGQIGHLLECEKEDPGRLYFPAYHSFDQEILEDVYVSVRKRCGTSDKCFAPMSQDAIDKLEADMLEKALRLLPRSHFGYDAPENETERIMTCLTETGHKTRKYTMEDSNSATCMFIYMASKYQLTEDGYHTDYYAGLLTFNRMDQEHFRVENGESIPHFMYLHNKLPCYMTKLDTEPEENMNKCYIYLSAETYAMFCCCYWESASCHFPNPMSIEFRPKYKKNLAAQNKQKLSCAYGNFSYSDVRKSEAELFKRTKWIDGEAVDDIKENVIGSSCQIIYEFVKTPESQPNFIMQMSAVKPGSNCTTNSEQFLCDLRETICPSTKPNNDDLNFSVLCCCGGELEENEGGEKSLKRQDLCNLDFLNHQVMDNFTNVFDNPLCSYRKHFHRLFSKHFVDGKETKVYCIVHYDVAAKKILYLLDGNNFEFLIKDYSSHRSDLINATVVLGNVLEEQISKLEDCSADTVFGQNRLNQRTIYIHTCDSDKDGMECDLEIEQNIETLYQHYKQNVMHKCLKYANQDVVISTRAELQKNLDSFSSEVYPDDSHLCIVYIQSIITKLPSSPPNTAQAKMTHSIRAGPIGSTLQEKSLDFQLWCKDIILQRVAKKGANYCFQKNANDELDERNPGNQNGTYFCCCFVGYEWEDCDLREKILGYVDALDVVLEDNLISEEYYPDYSCITESIQGAGIQQAIRTNYLYECIRPFSCFRIQDINDQKAKRFEIWSGCTSNIPQLVALSMHARLAQLCTTKPFLDITAEQPKCFVADLAEYFNDLKQESSSSNTYPFTLVCCCIGDCKGDVVNNIYGQALGKSEANRKMRHKLD
uniref:DDE-1 domain-containing protein n=1 Tax=Ditylenchus dipsaci TaxID=166011 RepID=A0A915DDC4_9BILA